MKKTNKWVDHPYMEKTILGDYIDFHKLVKLNVNRKTEGDIKELSDSEILRIWIFLSAFPKALSIVIKDLRKAIGNNYRYYTIATVKKAVKVFKRSKEYGHHKNKAKQQRV